MKPGMHALSGLPAGLMQRPYPIHLILPGRRPERLGRFVNRETNDWATNQPRIEWLRISIIVINLINLRKMQ